MIPQIKKILYATDLSRNSAYAFFYAVDLAEKRGATIVILHSIGPIPEHVKVYMNEPEKFYLDRQNTMVEKIHKRINDFCLNVQSHMKCSCTELVSKVVVRVGHPVDHILTVVDEEACDVIIMGTHGKETFMHSFLGSVSQGVLKNTKKPVFVIPLPPEKATIEWVTM
jgi:nucleotide-binding universal stress UspA family protein